MTTRTVTIDGISLDVTFDHCDAEPENGAPEDYDITAVYLSRPLHCGAGSASRAVHSIKTRLMYEDRYDISQLLSDAVMERIVKELEKIKND